MTTTLTQVFRTGLRDNFNRKVFKAKRLSFEPSIIEKLPLAKRLQE
jgi:hypothetical protein